MGELLNCSIYYSVSTDFDEILSLNKYLNVLTKILIITQIIFNFCFLLAGKYLR
jgi:hypothetical protein